MVLTRVPIKSSIPSSQQARDIRPPWGDSELTSAPMRLPDHQVLRTPAATPGEPTRDGVWQACSCPWPHSAYETIFYLDSGPGIPAVGKRVGWGCHGDPQAWIPRDAPCILPSLPLLIAGGERDSPFKYIAAVPNGCSAPAAGCGDRQHLGVYGVGRLRGTTFCVSSELSAPVTPRCYLRQSRAQISCLSQSVWVSVPTLSLC